LVFFDDFHDLSKIHVRAPFLIPIAKWLGLAALRQACEYEEKLVNCHQEKHLADLRCEERQAVESVFRI